MKTYYTHSLGLKKSWQALDGDAQTDVVIVGAGITGCATAVELCERGFNVIVLEANTVGWGATGRNGGQVTGSLSGDQAMLKQLRKTHGADAEDFVWNLRWRGHDIIKNRIERYAIDCDLKTGHLFTAWTEKDLPEFQAMVDDAHQRGMEANVSYLTKDELHERLQTPLYEGAVLNTKNLHLHSLKLCVGEAMAAESLGCIFHENTKVTNIKTTNQQLVEVETPTGTVRAKHVVLAGNAYHRLLRQELAGYLFPAKLGNLVTEPLGDALCQQINRDDNAVYDSRMVLDYYRITQDGRLMFGGGTNYSGRDISDVAKILRPSLEATFPALKGVAIDFSWTGTAGIVINRIPMLGKVKERIYYAQGYSGHGMATSHILAEIMATAVAGENEDLNTFESFWRWRVPVPAAAGSAMVALGMKYYLLKEHLAGRA